MAPVILYPAIDLKDGECVRVLHGDLDTATVFNTSPAAQGRARGGGRVNRKAEGGQKGGRGGPGGRGGG
ncbi:HisA/HisF-related TIM barrel protein, partial [Phenylobacterium sp.]|uniref:HisA/HisF-related TIM barrel protein n=1 Tax=Phenylobacterium sp. TaxID=1871053 RepID=UPI002FDC9BDB